MRALEMSMNALAVTELLMARGSVPLNSQPSNAYGSIIPSVPSTSNTPFRRPMQPESVTNSVTNSVMNNRTAASNIWGVPEESVLMEVSDNEGSEDELDQLERGNQGPELPPSSFNV
jgi:hypothetical protein